eukprot:403351479
MVFPANMQQATKLAKKIYKLKPVNKVSYKDIMQPLNTASKYLISGSGGAMSSRIATSQVIQKGLQIMGNPQQDDSERIQNQVYQNKIKGGSGSMTQRSMTNNSRVSDIQIRQISRQRQSQAQSLSRVMSNNQALQQQNLGIASIKNIQSQNTNTTNYQTGRVIPQVTTLKTQQNALTSAQNSDNLTNMSSTNGFNQGFSNEFLQKQRERQQKEQEVLLMENRIKLLEQEEEKIRKKIDQTKKKADEIMTNKQLNEAKQREKLALEQEQEQLLEEQRLKNLGMRDQIRTEMMEKQKELQEKIIQEVRERKKMRELNEKAIKDNSLQFHQENKQKRDKVKELEQKSKQTLDKYKQMRESMSKGQLEVRVDNENQKVSLADQKLKLLEQKEQAIIERLKQTQKTETKAKQMLIDAIQATSTGKKNRVMNDLSNETQTQSQYFNMGSSQSQSKIITSKVIQEQKQSTTMKNI